MSDPFAIDPAVGPRRSAQWTRAPRPGLPLWLAEMEVSLAPAVAAALHAAVDRSDTGYCGDPRPAIDAFVGFCASRWGWDVHAGNVLVFPDLYVAGRDLLGLNASRGPVVITPPVYNAFPVWLADAGADRVDVPLRPVSEGGRVVDWRLDLEGIDRAFAAGARTLLLCSPHNPTGTPHRRDELLAIAEIAATHGAVVLADEIHAPLTHPGTPVVPFLSVSDTARRVGVALHSASKAWNVPGLKCAFAVRCPESPSVSGLSEELLWSTGHLGMLAAEAAFADGTAWLDATVAALATKAERLTSVLTDAGIGVVRPRAGYLAWLDLTGFGLGPEAAITVAERSGVVLGSGSAFASGHGEYARLTFGIPDTTLEDALARIVAATAAS